MGIDHNKNMQIAYKQALKSYNEGGCPIGAALVRKSDGYLLAASHNMRVQNDDATSHGETQTLRDAGRLRADEYRDTILYTTLSPCIMCAGTLALYDIPEVIIGEDQTYKDTGKINSVDLLESRGTKVTILQDKDCITLMQKFITKNPKLWAEDIGVTYQEVVDMYDFLEPDMAAA